MIAIKRVGLIESREQKIIEKFLLLRLSYHGVEQEFECAVSLTSILSAESEHNHLPVTVLSVDHGRHTGDMLFADEPSALQEIFILISNDRLILFAVLAGSDGEGFA